MGKGAAEQQEQFGGDGAFDLRWGFQNVGRGQVCLGENLSPRAGSQRTASSGRLHTGLTAAAGSLRLVGCVLPIPST